MNAITTRLAMSKDLDAIVRILNQSILRGNENGRLKTVEVSEFQEWFLTHEPSRRPILIAEKGGEVVGWLSLSAYRPGREALLRTAEITYYVDHRWQRQGVGTRLVEQALSICPSLGIKVLVGFLLEHNQKSVALLQKFGFEQWGFFPQAANINGNLVGQICYGRLVQESAA